MNEQTPVDMKGEVDRTPVYAWGIFLAIANIIAVVNGLTKGGWAVLGTIYIIAPILNAVFLVSGIIMVASMKRRYRDADLTGYWLAVALLPFLMFVASFLVLLYAPHHGGGC